MSNSISFDNQKGLLLVLIAILILSPILLPNTVLPGAGGIVGFSDGSTIDTTNSTSYIGTPLAFVAGIHSCVGGCSGGRIRGGACIGGCGRRNLSFVGALSNSTDISSYAIFNLGSLTFAITQWYMAVALLFLALIVGKFTKCWIREE